MTAHRGGRDREGCMELSGGHGLAGEELDHSAPGGIGQRGQSRVARILSGIDIYHIREIYHVSAGNVAAVVRLANIDWVSG